MRQGPCVCVALCGSVLHGAAWCGSVRRGVTWCGVVRVGAVWCGSVRVSVCPLADHRPPCVHPLHPSRTSNPPFSSPVQPNTTYKQLGAAVLCNLSTPPPPSPPSALTPVRRTPSHPSGVRPGAGGGQGNLWGGCGTLPDPHGRGGSWPRVRRQCQPVCTCTGSCFIVPPVILQDVKSSWFCCLPAEAAENAALPHPTPPCSVTPS